MRYGRRGHLRAVRRAGAVRSISSAPFGGMWASARALATSGRARRVERRRRPSARSAPCSHTCVSCRGLGARFASRCPAGASPLPQRPPYASQAMRSAVRPSSAALRSHAQPRRAAPAPRLSAGARHMATQNAPVNRTLPKITFEQMDSWVRTSQPHCAPTQVSSIVRCSSPSASARLQTSMPARHRGMTLRLSLSL